jgi:thiol-disulfide isomerase/thioredoxin
MNLIEMKQKLKNAAGGKTQVLIMLLVVVLFVVAGLIVYRRYISANVNNKYVTNNEFSQNKIGGDGSGSADIYFFFTEWCPHCKTAKPIWADFKKQMSGKDVNGIKLNFFEVDCDKDSATSDKFNVKGFPTIKLMKGNQIIEYDAKPSTVNLIEFVNTSLSS